MLLVGGTYQNNLVFMMAFILLALGLVTIIQTARNIRDLEILQIHIEPAFEQKKAKIKFIIKNKSKRSAHNIFIKAADLSKKKFFRPHFIISPPLSIDRLSLATVEMTYPNQLPWGLYKIEHFELATSYPYGLFTAWIIQKLKTDYFIYPQPAGAALNLNFKVSAGDDYSQHRPFYPGDSFSRIDWKKKAQGRGLLTKEFTDNQNDQVVFNLEELNFEKPQQISKWINDCFNNKIEVGLKTKDSFISPSIGPLHFHKIFQEFVQSKQQEGMLK